MFFEPIDLRARLNRSPTFTVAEFGFGTALNLAVLLDHWQRSAQPRLHYISCEQHPLNAADWTRISDRRRPQLPAYEALAALYPPLVPGWHRRILADGAITLSLFWGSAEAMLDDLGDRQRIPVDAWLLDGFAPERNPELWSPELLARLPDWSSIGTTVSTFTSAGRVRRALAEAGFAMRRVDQMPIKLHSLAGVLETAAARAPPSGNSEQAAWAQARQQASERPIEIVGAGIAGACLARHLAEAGFQCRVFDAAAAPLGASRLALAVAHSRLLADGSSTADQRAAAQLYSSHFLERTAGAALAGSTLQLAGTDPARQKLRQIARRYGDPRWCRPLDAAELQARLGVFASAARNGDSGGEGAASAELMALEFPDARIVSPALAISALLDHPNIRCFWQQPLPLLHPSAASDSLVDGIDASRDGRGLRIIASGASIRAQPAAHYLELAALGGQLERVAVAAGLTQALVGAGYCVPVPGTDNGQRQQLLLGGNYEYQPWAPAAATAANLQQLGSTLPYRHLGYQRALRLTTSDRQPVAGLLFAADGTALRAASGAVDLVSVGFGSQGFTQAPVAAALITSRLQGIVPPLTEPQEASFSSRRFRLRQARRGPWNPGRGNERS